MTTPPSRQSEVARCENCGDPVDAGIYQPERKIRKDRRFCGPYCRVTAWRKAQREAKVADRG